jgi:replication factor C subunit 3/5
VQEPFTSAITLHSSAGLTRGEAAQEIANDILTEQSPKRLFQVRGKVYELLTNVVPPELIMRQLTAELLKKLDDEVKHEVR